jgi:ZIP family zinc transporter
MIGPVMSPVLATTLRCAIIPVVFTVIGAAMGVYFPLLARLRGHVVHFAAGVVFAVVAVELLPELQRRALVWDVVWGFGFGIVTMLAVDKILDRIRGDDVDDTDAPNLGEGAAHRASPSPARAARSPARLLGAVAIDFLLDGLLLGVGFAAGARIGILLALAEAAEQSVLDSHSSGNCAPPA